MATTTKSTPVGKPVAPVKPTPTKQVTTAAPKQISKGRAFGAFVCFAIAIVLLALVNLATWLNATLTDTDKFVGTTSALINDKEVQKNIGDTFADTILKEASNREELVKELSTKVPGVTTENVDAKISETVVTALSDPKFQSEWDRVIREAHTLFTNTEQNQQNPQLNFRPLLENVKTNLAATEFAELATMELPANAGVVEIKDAKQIQDVQRAIQLGQMALWVMTGVAVILVIGGTLLANYRVRALGIFGVVLGLVLLFGVGFVRGAQSLASKQGGDPNIQTAREVVTTLTAPLVAQSLKFAIISIVVGVVLILMHMTVLRKKV